MPDDNNPPMRSNHTHRADDPVFLHTLREAKIILSMWVATMLFTCTYCYLFGYSSHPSDPAATGTTISDWVGPLEQFNRTADSITTPLGLGIPDWVFYGVVIPWIVCIVVSIIFCVFIYHDDDLGEDREAKETATGDMPNG